MIDTEALRKKVIDLAIQGKLTEQLPSDGDAETLYAQIQLEKKKIIDSGVLKNRKKGEILTVDGSIVPFEIPNNWKWIRLGNVSEIFGRIGFRGYTKNDIVSPHTGAITISPSNILNNGRTDFEVCTYLSWEKYNESPEIMIENDDVLVVKTGSSYGKSGIVKNLPEKATINPQIAVLKYVLCDSEYINYMLNSSFSRSQFEEFVVGAAIPTFSQEKLSSLLMPLPPLAEQKRIVNRIEEVFGQIEIINDLQAKYRNDLAVLKSKIIDAGIQGKLTEQLPEDGDAETLYAQIQEEKAKLIKEGKIKKEKALPDIAADEIPFEIPKNWKWVRIGQIFFLQAGKNKVSSDIHSDADERYKYPCYGGNGLRGYVDESNVSGKRILIGRQGALCGNINIAENDFWATEHAVVVYQFANTVVDCYEYMFRALNLNQYATSVAQPGLAVGNIERVLIPLLPLSEQVRIAEKMTKCAIIFENQRI